MATNSDEEGTSLYNKGMTDLQLERMDFGKILLKKRDEGVVEYVRSQSPPVRELTFEDGGESHSQTKKQNGNGNKNAVPDHSRSDSAIDQQEILKTKIEFSHSEVLEKSKISKSKGEEKLTNGERDSDEITGTADLNESAGSVLLSPELEVPKKFDFSGSSESIAEGLPKPATNDEPNDRGQVEGGVFVFTAITISSSDPSSPDYVKSKKKTVGVSFNLSPQEIVGGGEEISRDEMALLAQQLELGGSDNVSQGHLFLLCVYVHVLCSYITQCEMLFAYIHFNLHTVHTYSLHMGISLYIVHMHDMYKINEGEFYYTYTLNEYLHNCNNYCVLSQVLQLIIMIGV